MTKINFNVSNLNITDKTFLGDRSPKIAAESLQKLSGINQVYIDFTGDLGTMRTVAEIGGLEKSTSQVNDAISILERVNSSSGKIIAVLGDMRDLAAEAAGEGKSVTDRAKMDLEFGASFTRIRSLATDIPDSESLAVNNSGAEFQVNNLGSIKKSLRPVGEAVNDAIRIPFKTWDPASASRGNVVQQTVDPVTGLQLIAGNQFTPDGLISGGKDLPLGDPEMLDYDLSGNDDSISQGKANQSARATETQAFGSAVLWAGDNYVDESKSVRLNLLSKINAEYVLENIDKAVSAALEERASLNAHIDKLETAAAHLANLVRGEKQPALRIDDARFAIEASESSRNQIISKEGSGLSIQGDAPSEAILEFLMK
jgi:flagellin-like hook-associated protein FlgL